MSNIFSFGGGGGDGEHIELTQAEYDALPVKDPNTIYFITDSSEYADQEKSNVTLFTSNWDNGVYTVSDNHITSDSIQLITPMEGITDSQLEALQGANLQSYGQDEGHLYLKVYGDVPEIDVPITIVYHPGIRVKEVEPQKQDIYSTNETVIGTWIDGKPVYRKIYRVTGSFTDVVNIDQSLNPSVVDELISMRGTYKNSRDYWFRDYALSSSDRLYMVMGPAGSGTFNGLYATIQGDTIVKIIVTVEYTKTTD